MCGQFRSYIFSFHFNVLNSNQKQWKRLATIFFQIFHQFRFNIFLTVSIISYLPTTLFVYNVIIDTFTHNYMINEGKCF